MPPKVLVTGATGFIGSHLIEEFVSRKWDVFCLIRKESRTSFLNKFPVTLKQAEIDDISALEQAVAGMDYIFHSAARIRAAPKKVYDRANFQFTRNLCRACLKANPHIRRLLYISSIAAAGPSPEGKIKDESNPSEPTSEYGRSKLRGEEAVREVWDQIPCTIIRPPNVYGPRQQETELLLRLLNKRIFPVLKMREKNTTLIYVKDLAIGMLQAALSDKTAHEIYYLTDGNLYSWREVLFRMKEQVLGRKIYLPLHENMIYAAAFLTDMLRKTKLVNVYFGRKIWNSMVNTFWLFSSKKAERDFGFTPSFSLEKGFRSHLNRNR
ncbi:MAG: NAD-dependent epimerase/dehydratase family protein [Candidatus Aminicenantes bacterium]|nr:NAD-dependent epimerase/dehydratase family protein [Candidatus Aminicenantes bacterium]